MEMDACEENRLLLELRILMQESQMKYFLEDELLLCFIRGRKFNVDRAFKSLSNFLKMSDNNPELMKVNEGEIRRHLNRRIHAISSNTESNDMKILFYRCSRWNPSEITLDDIFRCNLYCLETLASDPYTQRNGIVIIIDFEGHGLHHVRQLTPSYAKKFASLFIDVFPLRIHAIHLLHQNWVVGILLTMINPFLPSKLRNRIHYHGTNLHSLHKHVSPTNLPKDYEGEQEPLDNFDWDTMLNGCGRSMFDLN